LNSKAKQQCLKIFNSLLMMLITLSFTTELNANDISVKNVRLTGQISGSHTFVNFDLSWENSWRNSTNYDAAWLFVKYKVGTGEWMHATLSATPTDHTAPTGSTISPASDSNGVFIYRSSNGTGDNNFNDVALRWLYPTDGVANDAQLTVKVFAIEMVYIPQGSFSVGDSVSEKRFHTAGDTLAPFTITSEQAITLNDTITINPNPASLWATGDMETGTGVIPAEFPKGYNAFYIMKYEITQGQYTDFLNMLTSAQADQRFGPDTSNLGRYTITGTHPSFTTNRPSRACSFLSSTDGAAYADWAALRPITEFEFEKAARGTAPVVAGEYAWGNTNIDITGDLSGNEDGTETVTDGLNCNHQVTFISGDGGFGPVRSGIFAATTNTREGSGGSLYGVMEMSGNLWETVVSSGLAVSRSFQGTHGNGLLASNGNATNSDWPGFSGGTVSTNGGVGGRGGGFQNLQIRLQISNRFYMNIGAAREWSNGYRAGRTAE
jgi:formylglycine-generating enzyme required for sulfatase activity